MSITHRETPMPNVWCQYNIFQSQIIWKRNDQTAFFFLFKMDTSRFMLEDGKKKQKSFSVCIVYLEKYYISLYFFFCTCGCERAECVCVYVVYSQKFNGDQRKSNEYISIPRFEFIHITNIKFMQRSGADCITIQKWTEISNEQRVTHSIWLFWCAFYC